MLTICLLIPSFQTTRLFKTWCDENDVWSQKLEIFEGDNGSRGLRAKETIHTGEGESKWSPYIRTLPKSPVGAAGFDSETIKELRPTGSDAKITRWLAFIDEQYSMLLANPLAPEGSTLELWRLAVSIVHSRALSYEPDNRAGEAISLIPFCDCLNHTPDDDPPLIWGWDPKVISALENPKTHAQGKPARTCTEMPHTNPQSPNACTSSPHPARVIAFPSANAWLGLCMVGLDTDS
eukprot:6048-Prorocentrum_minimum.AAC.2